MQQVLFIQGGGDDGYEADKAMASSLRTALGAAYQVYYPRLASDESVNDFGWPAQIAQILADSKAPLIVVAHSVGASLLLKLLSETPGPYAIKGLFLVAVPFWSGAEDWKQGLILRDNFAAVLPLHLPIFLYHSQDDEVVPIAQLSHYMDQLPQATIRQTKKGGHQFNNDLRIVAEDIRRLG